MMTVLLSILVAFLLFGACAPRRRGSGWNNLKRWEIEGGPLKRPPPPAPIKPNPPSGGWS